MGEALGRLPGDGEDGGATEAAALAGGATEAAALAGGATEAAALAGGRSAAAERISGDCILDSASPASPITAIGAPTGTLAPSPTLSARITPPASASWVTVALSVSISTSGCPGST